MLTFGIPRLLEARSSVWQRIRPSRSTAGNAFDHPNQPASKAPTLRRATSKDCELRVWAAGLRGSKYRHPPTSRKDSAHKVPLAPAAEQTNSSVLSSVSHFRTTTQLLSSNKFISLELVARFVVTLPRNPTHTRRSAGESSLSTPKIAHRTAADHRLVSTAQRSSPPENMTTFSDKPFVVQSPDVTYTDDEMVSKYTYQVLHSRLSVSRWRRFGRVCCCCWRLQQAVEACFFAFHERRQFSSDVSRHNTGRCFPNFLGTLAFLTPQRKATLRSRGHRLLTETTAVPFTSSNRGVGAGREAREAAMLTWPLSSTRC